MFASELKSIVERGRDRAGGRSRRAGGLDPLLLGAAGALRHQGRREAAPGHLGRVPARRSARPCTRYWAVAEVAAEAAAGPPADLREVIEESVAAHLVADVPVSSFLSGGLDSSIVTVLAKRRNPALDAYTITFRAAGPPPRGDARRRHLRPQGGPRSSASRSTRSRRAGHRRAAPPDRRHPRRADRRPGRHQHPAHVRGGPRRRREGDAVRHGRRRAVRRLPQAPGLPARPPATGGSRRRPDGPSRRGVDRLPVVAGGRGLRHVRWAKRFLAFAELPEADGVPAELHPLRPAGARRPGQPRPGPATSTTSSTSTTPSTPTTTLPTRSTGCAWPTPGCSSPASISPTPTGPAWPPRSRSGCPSSTRPWSAAAFSIPGATKIRGRTTKAALKEAAAAWLPHEIIHRPKASFSAPLRAWISHDLRETVDEELLGGELVAQRLPPARAARAAGRRRAERPRGPTPSRSGSCSPSRCGAARPEPAA